MRYSFNITTCEEDLRLLSDPAALAVQLEGFDGVELQLLDEPAEGLIDPAIVTGLHMACIPCWYALWEQDEEALVREFSDLETAESYYGGLGRNALLNRFRRDLLWAEKLGAEYLVFHVAESTVEESFTEDYARTEEEVCRACAEVLDALFGERNEGPLLLLENLWQPGLNLKRPETTRDMLASVRYPNTGIMLDTGHLMNAYTDLRSQEEAVCRIHRVLDGHAELSERFRGVHLNASLSGAYAEKIKAAPPALCGSYAKRQAEMFGHVFRRDMHRPFTADGVKGLIERIAPDYLTCEMISSSPEERRALNTAQLKALGRL